MKLIALVMIALLIACAPKLVNIKTMAPQVGIEKTVFTGDVFFEYVNCYGEDNHAGIVFNGDCVKKELTVVGISKEKITLQYREYMKPLNRYGGFRVNAPWLIKEAFTKNLEYSTSSDKIKYQSHNFKILKRDESSISYVSE